MSTFYKALLIRTRTTETVIEVDDSATEDEVREAVQDRAASVENRDCDKADTDAAILAENVQWMV